MIFHPEKSASSAAWVPQMTSTSWHQARPATLLGLLSLALILFGLQPGISGRQPGISGRQPGISDKHRGVVGQASTSQKPADQRPADQRPADQKPDHQRPEFTGKLSAARVSDEQGSGTRRTIACCGRGWLEEDQGLLILHVAGSPYQMGYQHGALLREHAQANLNGLFDKLAAEWQLKWGPLRLGPEAVIAGIVAVQEKYLPQWYTEELRGLADGAGVSFRRAQRANFIPELFHCSGFAVMNSATVDGTLYHGRVLDYATDWKLQEHALILVAHPDDGIASVNITFAGFIGCVTGMNAQQISLGEMGGGGLLHWNGVPMAVLMRQALQEARSLEQCLAVFRDQPRTCQYFYVAADGETNRAVGFEASWNQFATVSAGQSHPLLPRPVEDAVLLSAGNRYHCLVDRVQAKHGQLDAASALRLMDRGVATRSNLHNALFAPKTTDFWVSYAGPEGTPAAKRPYAKFRLTELLSRKPDPTTREIPMPQRQAPLPAAQPE